MGTGDNGVSRIQNSHKGFHIFKMRTFYNIGIFSKTEQNFDLEDKPSPV